MKLQKISIALLAMLALLAMIPMVSANAITTTATANNPGGYIQYGSTGTHSTTVYNWQVWVEVYSPGGSLVQSKSTTCSSGTSCSTGTYSFTPSSGHGYYTVIAYATADGHSVASNSKNVYW